METKPALSAAVVEVLNQDNYLDWSVRVKTYLMAQDLWDIVESSRHSPIAILPDLYKVSSKTNAMALHVIQISCGPDTFSDIREITSAKIAWDTLARKYKPKGPDPSSSMASIPSEEDKLDSSTKPGESDKEGDINDDVEIYMNLNKALKIGDWNAAQEFLNRNPDAISAKITVRDKTALHVAAEAGHVHIVEELVKLMSEENLEIKDIQGFTALAEAACIGNYRIAECLLGKNQDLISIPASDGTIPVIMALFNGHLKLGRYLYLLTPLEILRENDGRDGASLLCTAIYSKALDIALDLVQRCPSLAFAQSQYAGSPFSALARMPDLFPSGCRLVFWKRWIYSSIHIQLAGPIDEIRLTIQKLERNGSNDKETSASGLSLLSRLVSNLQTLLGIKHLYEMKLAHFLSYELLCRMRDQLSIMSNEQTVTSGVYQAIIRATQEGIFEFFFEIVNADQQLIWTKHEKSSSLFSVAVQCRHAKIFSLIYGLDIKSAVASSADTLNDNYLLHMAGMLAPSTSLNHIPGAALKMQRELQWFKEVESITPTVARGRLNREGLTPRQFFTKNHEDMMAKGEKWMKDTASSCTVVGALIVTIMFAAVFTVPGGNDQNNGFPIFLNKKLFMVFIVSDALSLFSSSTSVLMFLGILTSRYAEEDFLESLPRKMIIGLSTLFFSIAAMMTAFTAALFLMLYEQSWIFIPVICLASVPVTLFVLMQFPLLIEMIILTYRPRIFDRKNGAFVLNIH